MGDFEFFGRDRGGREPVSPRNQDRQPSGACHQKNSSFHLSVSSSKQPGSKIDSGLSDIRSGGIYGCSAALQGGKFERCAGTARLRWIPAGGYRRCHNRALPKVLRAAKGIEVGRRGLDFASIESPVGTSPSTQYVALSTRAPSDARHAYSLPPRLMSV